MHEEAQLPDHRLTRLAAKVEERIPPRPTRASPPAAPTSELMDQRIAQINGNALEGPADHRRVHRAPGDAREPAGDRAPARCARASRHRQLLHAVEIEQQHSSQALLEALNRRQDVPLRPGDVEGLSVAAITYIVKGLVSYLAKAGRAWTALSPRPRPPWRIPLVAGSMW